MISSVEGNIVDIHTESIYSAKIIIKDGAIIEIAKNNNQYKNYILPGFVDAHVHIESSLLTPARFAQAAVSHGTIAAVSDPHEIANVCGLQGIKFMIESGNSVPLYFSFGAPSCVPSTEFETNGAKIDAKKIKILFDSYNLKYLSEVMNYPDVINRETEVLQKIQIAKSRGRKIDGHAPNLMGPMLKTYASFGISTDHECTNVEEAKEKISNGIKILIREGSAARNFDALASLIDSYPDDVMLCTDDLHPDILLKFHIDELIRRGLKMGLNLFKLLRASSLNPIYHYGLPAGLLRVNDSADFITVNNLYEFIVLQTWIKGLPVYDNGKVNFNPNTLRKINNFHAKPITADQLSIKIESQKINVINILEDQLITLRTIENAKIINGHAVCDPDEDILKLVVVNRYVERTDPSVAFVKNFGLKDGAIASSISHDSHNIIAVGSNDQDLLSAINILINSKGGLVFCRGADCTILELEIAGLMTQKPAIEVAIQLSKLNELIHNYGSHLKAPFMTLSFLSLIVIPHLKLSDKGLFDVDKFSFTELFVK